MVLPGEFAVVSASVDEHVGGRHVVEMLEPDGSRLAFESVIRDLVENERIVLDFAFVGPDSGEREETLLTVTLADAPGGGTERPLRPRADHARPAPLRQPRRQRRLDQRPREARGALREEELMLMHRTGTREQWREARLALLEREKS